MMVVSGLRNSLAADRGSVDECGARRQAGEHDHPDTENAQVPD